MSSNNNAHNQRRKVKTHDDPNLSYLNMADFRVAAMQFAQQACPSNGTSVPVPSGMLSYGIHGSLAPTTSMTMTNRTLSDLQGVPSGGSISKGTGTASSSVTTTSISISSTPVAPTTTQPSSSPAPTSWGISVRALRWQYVGVFFVTIAFVVEIML